MTLAFATENHCVQYRKKGSHYISHPIVITSILKSLGYNTDCQIDIDNKTIYKGSILMTIEKITNNENLTLKLVGRLDTTTAPILEAELSQSLDGIKNLTLDFENLEYISSAGLRILLAAQKQMNNQGEMVLCNVNSDVSEVFEITGFSDFLNIQ